MWAAWWSCDGRVVAMGCMWDVYGLHICCIWAACGCGGCVVVVGCMWVVYWLHMGCIWAACAWERMGRSLSGRNNEKNGFGGCICMRENGKMELWVWKWRTQKWPCKYGAQEFIGWQEARDEVLDFRWWHIFIWNHIAFMHGSNIWVLIRLPCNKIDHWKHSFLREACKF